MIKIGTMRTCGGIIMLANIKKNNNRFKGKSFLANAYPTRVQKIILPMVIMRAMSVLLKKYRPNEPLISTSA